MLRKIFSWNFRRNRSISHNDHSICNADYLRQFAGDNDYRASPLGELVDKIIDFVLCPYVDSASGLIHDDDAQIRQIEPTRQNHFLLVTAGEEADLLSPAWRLDS